MSGKIQQFQTDNSGKHLSTQFASFLQENDIFHRLMCLYTSQQIDIAEREYRHIDEIGLTLLAWSLFPNTYW